MNSIISGDFESELNSLKANNPLNFYEYDGSQSFVSVTTAHSGRITRKEKYDIYVIRQKSGGEVLYVGKGGTVNTSGQFRGQDLPARLKNVKGNDITADKWFADLFKEKGLLIIEYVFLPAIPFSPGFVESLLLQAYLNQHGKLPLRNNSF